jgi:dihydroflavonol-4-reductase
MRYAVTGATGFLGANLVRRLLGEGHDVLALIRRENTLVEGLPIELSTVPLVGEGDEHLSALSSVLKGCDGIFHVAGIFDPSPGGDERMVSVHVDATDRLCQAALRSDVARVVLCSSSITVGFGSRDAPGDEDTPYDADQMYGGSGALRAYHDTKLASEQIILNQTDVEGVVVNPDFILGPWDVKPTSGQLIVTMARRWVPFYPSGGKCFQSASDCANGHLLAMEKGTPGRRYLLGSHNHSYREFMGMVAEVVGRRPPAWALPSAVTTAAGLAGRVGQRIDSHRFAGLDPHVLRSMSTERYRSDHRARTELGLVPSPLKGAITAAHEWFSERGYC